MKAASRNSTIKQNSQHWDAQDEELSAALYKAQVAVRESLCDSFNTPKAVNELQALVSVANIYLTRPATEIKEPLIRQVSKYVYYILKCFGVYSDDDAPSVLNDEQAVDYEA